MRIVADLHIHSRYSRATSREMNLAQVAAWASVKGIDVVGTGDFTHPAHFASIEKELEETEPGLFSLKGMDGVHFMLTTEVSNIYKKDGRTRKIHNLIFAPDLMAVRKMNAAFAKLGNIHSDGRPIFGFSSEDLLRIVLDASEDAMLVPAHAWTPWFSIFGSRSGFDSIEECFGDLSHHIYAIETGLSSNPAMNWRLSALDSITLISNSDAHSPAKLGREANVFDCALDYREITEIIKTGDRDRFLYTIEFYPEEGKYHADGHRNCGVVFTPDQTRAAGGICPVCGEELTVGVLSRVEALADRPAGFVPSEAVPARHLVPLQEIISTVLASGVNTMKVKKEYRRITAAGGSEYAVLLDMPEGDIEKIAGPLMARAIIRVRKGELDVRPGYDGEFGRIRIPLDAERTRPRESQISLF